DFTLYPGDIISGGGAGTAADSAELSADGSSAPERFLKPGAWSRQLLASQHLGGRGPGVDRVANVVRRVGERDVIFRLAFEDSALAQCSIEAPQHVGIAT